MFLPGGEGPGGVLLSFLVAAALFLPGAWAALLAAEHFGLDAAEALALSFAATIALAGLVSAAAWWLGSSLTAVAAALVLGAVASAVLAVSRHGRRRWLRGGLAGVVIAVAAAGLSLFQGQALGGTQDQFYHLAAMRSLLASGRPLVTDPLFGTAARVLDPTTGAWHPFGASLAMLSRLDVVTLLPGFTAGTAVAFVACLWSLFRRVSRGRLVPALVTVAFLGIVESFDFRFAAYPNRFSLGLALFALVLLARAATSARARPALAVAAAGAGFGVLVTHLGTAEVYLLGAVVLVAYLAAAILATRRKEQPFEAGGLVAAGAALVAAGSLSLPVVLPRFAALQGTDSVSARAAESIPLAAFTLLGRRLVVAQPAPLEIVWLLASVPLIALAALAVGRSRDERAFLAIALGSMRVVLLFDPLVLPSLLGFSPYMTARLSGLLLFAPFCLVAWALSRGFARREARSIAWCLGVLIAAVILTAPAVWLIWTGPMGNPSTLAYTRAADVRSAWGVGQIERLRAVFGEGRPLVAAFPNTALQMAGIADVRVIAVPKENTPAHFERLPGAHARQSDMYAIVDAFTPEPERALMARGYGARFLVVDVLHVPSLAPTVEALLQDPSFRLAYQSSGLYVFEVE